jgi:hypothetical protein
MAVNRSESAVNRSELPVDRSEPAVKHGRPLRPLLARNAFPDYYMRAV